MEKLIFGNSQAPGDTVVLTAAVRDLHRAFPGRFVTDVRTPHPEIWHGNPHLTDLDEFAVDVREIACEYPLIHRANVAPYHFLHGFIHDLGEKLGLHFEATTFKGDIHLLEQEKAWPPVLGEAIGPHREFWVIVSGGKYDYTAKWWDPQRLQEVVEYFAGRITFVQVGADGDYHPPLAGVVDLRGKTDLRQLIQVVYHAQGVLTPVSLPMHLAAAIETKPGQPPSRPCVVIAGGREPPHWEAYPQHQFIHTSGALTCCASGGCWKARAYPLGDGSDHDRPDQLCTNLVGSLPRCMDMIAADEVIRRIETYYTGGVLTYGKMRPVEQTRGESSKDRFSGESGMTAENAVRESERFLRNLSQPPADLNGRGIVICGGGARYFPCAYVAIRMLRKLGCSLPIELWYLGPLEMDETMRELVRPFGVTCRDGRSHHKRLERRNGGPVPWRRLGGYELKPFSIVHSAFRDVLFLDADNVPVENPEFLFEHPEYARTGAIFWPDYGRLAADREIWDVCGVPYRDEPEFESGQIVVDKARCWNALQLTLWYNERSDFFYRYILGDKDTFHMAFRKLERRYAMPAVPIHPLDYTMCQHDFDGRRIFQHRNLAKWAFRRPNLRIHDFWYEEECLGFLGELQCHWSGRIEASSEPHEYEAIRLKSLAAELSHRVYRYHRVGHDSRLLSFRQDGTIGQGAAEKEAYWDVHLVEGRPLLEIGAVDRATCFLGKEGSGTWKGHWLSHEKMPIELIPS